METDNRMKDRQHYVATPTSQRPVNSGKYFCINPNNQPYSFLEVLRYDKYNNTWHDDLNGNCNHPEFWLRPLSSVERDKERVEFAEWTSINDWTFDTGGKVWYDGQDNSKYKTTTDLLQMFREQRKEKP